MTYKSEKKPAFRHSNRKLDRRNSGAKALESGCTRCSMGKERRLSGQHEGKRETNRMGVADSGYMVIQGHYIQLDGINGRLFLCV